MSSPEAPEQLYAAREPVFPRRVKGKFRNLKWLIMIVTLGIYYLTPWIRWDRGPELPDQAVLVDLASRRFFFFWIEIWPHEFYFVAGLLIMAGLGLFLLFELIHQKFHHLLSQLLLLCLLLDYLHYLKVFLHLHHLDI